jgi:hypothetical protein
MKPRIFVGSSTKVIELAREVGKAIEGAGMTAAVWDTGAFPVGTTLLERIDSLGDEFQGPFCSSLRTYILSGTDTQPTNLSPTSCSNTATSAPD